MKTAKAGLIKKIMAALSEKTDELRTRIMIFFLLHRNNNFLMDKLRPLNVSSSRYYRHQRRSTKGEVEDNNNINYYDYVGGEDYGSVMKGGDEAEVIKAAHDNSRDYVICVNEDRRGRSGGPVASTEMEITIEDVPKKVVAYTTATQGVVSTTNREDPLHAAATDTLFKQSEEEMKQVDQFSNENLTQLMMSTTPSAGVGNEEEEEDIDQAADLFIQRFRRQIQLQKQLSLDRHTHIMV